MDEKYPHSHNVNFYFKMKLNQDDHSECNPDHEIHTGLYLNQLGCIHNNPNDETVESATYIWSKKYKQWKRARYFKNHHFCKCNSKCVYWDDDSDSENDNIQLCPFKKR